MKKLAYALICSTALVTATLMPFGPERSNCWAFAIIFAFATVLTNEKS